MNIVFCTLFFLFVGLVKSNEPKCVLKQTFAKVCHFYDITNTNGCFRYSLENCRIFRTTYNEFRCPKYICTEVKINLIIIVLLITKYTFIFLKYKFIMF